MYVNFDSDYESEDNRKWTAACETSHSPQFVFHQQVAPLTAIDIAVVIYFYLRLLQPEDWVNSLLRNFYLSSLITNVAFLYRHVTRGPKSIRNLQKEGKAEGEGEGYSKKPTKQQRLIKKCAASQ